MSLIVKFGNTIIMKESLPKIVQEIKKQDWTENKIYKLATNVEVKPLISQKKKISTSSEQDIILKVKGTKEKIERILSTHFSKEYSSMESELKELGEIEKEMSSKNDYQQLSSIFFQQFLEFRKVLCGIKGIEKSDFDWLILIDSSDLEVDLKNPGTSKIIKIIQKYRPQIMRASQFQTLNKKDNEQFQAFLDNQLNQDKIIEKPQAYVSKKQNPPVEDPYEKILKNIDPFSMTNTTTSKKIPPGDTTDELVNKLIQFQDFRMSVNNPKLTDNEIMSFFKAHQDLNKAAELYFCWIYKSDSLKLSYVFPDRKEYPVKFQFTASPEELFVSIYAQFPDSNPKLFYQNKEIVINPSRDKFIGSLGIQMNSKIYVQI